MQVKVYLPGLYAINVFASDMDGYNGNDNHLDQYESDEEAPRQKIKTKSERRKHNDDDSDEGGGHYSAGSD